MKLYDNAVSGNCHKVRLFLSIFGIDCETVPMNLVEKEQKTPTHLARHPLGKIPALEDGDLTIWDSQAILVYLGGTYGSPDWWPADAAGQAQVTQWLAFAVNEMFAGPAIARALLKFKRDGDLAGAQALAHDALAVLESRLRDNDWLALGRPTIADLACYPYAGLVWEGEVSLEPYAAIQAWLQRVEALPGYVGMEGLPHS